MNARHALAIVACFLFVACASRITYAQPETVNRDAEAQELMQLSRAWSDTVAAGNTEYNKVVTVWKRQPDGSWKNVVDMWNAAPTGGE